jgi:hypothetical protein
MGNFLIWLFLGELIAGGIAAFAVTISWIPIILLPHLWQAKRLWGVAKIGIFIIGSFLVTVVANLVSAGAIFLLDIFAEPRTTLWWGGLWGVFS